MALIAHFLGETPSARCHDNVESGQYVHRLYLAIILFDQKPFETLRFLENLESAHIEKCVRFPKGSSL